LRVGKDEAKASSSMGFWRSLRQWWSWDGSPDTDPFRDRASESDRAGSVDLSGHAHTAPDTEPAGPPAEDDDA
jgi:hypothetical protein